MIIRKESNLSDITKAGKLSSYWPATRHVQRANIRINGIRRYGEDLDSRGMFMELRRLHPEAAISELFQDEWEDWNGANQIIVFNVQMDYTKELLSGVKTASQTSPLIVDIEWSNNFNPNNENLRVDILVRFVKWLAISREQIEVIE